MNIKPGTVLLVLDNTESHFHSICAADKQGNPICFDTRFNRRKQDSFLMRANEPELDIRYFLCYPDTNTIRFYKTRMNGLELQLENRGTDDILVIRWKDKLILKPGERVKLLERLLKEEYDMDKSLYLKDIDFETASESEVQALHQSNHLNQECAEAIHNAIAQNYGTTSQWSLDTEKALEDVLKDYSPERVAYVVAVRMHDNTWDRRISDDNTRWAQELLADVPAIYKDKQSSPFHLSSYLSSDDGLLDLFAKELRSQYGDVKLAENDKVKAPKKAHKQVEYGD